MTKKFFGIFLALMLVFGGVASAAELSLNVDLASADETATVRGVLSGFYGEVEIGKMVEIKGELGNNEIKKGIVGTNIGIKLEAEDPFYGIGQINFGAMPLDGETVDEDPFDDKSDVTTYDWQYEAVEIGGGAEIQVFKTVEVGMEATLVNDNPVDLGEFSPNFSIFASLDFAGFPGLEI